MKHSSKTFTGTVELDGNEYTGCTFNKCLLVYSGGAVPSLTDSDLIGVRFEFREAAANTVALMKLMAAPNSGLQHVIRDTFPSLRLH